MMEPSDLIHFLTTRGREIMLERFIPQSCIASTRVGLEVLKAHGILAWPTATAVDVLNDQAEAIYRAGDFAAQVAMARGWPGAKHLVVEGTGALDHRTGQWDAHLVIETVDSGGTGVVIDLSLDQFARPALGIDLHADAFALPTGWPVAWSRDGVTVLYRKLKTKTFRQARDWTHRDRWEPTLAKIMEETR